MKKAFALLLLACMLLSACAMAKPAEAAAPAQPKTVSPMPTDLSLEKLDNCTFAAAFEPSDVYVREGNLVISLVPFYSFRYAAGEIDALAVGDTLMLADGRMKVEALKREKGHVEVNGGTKAGGCDLYAGEDGIYVQRILGQGDVMLPLANTVLEVDPDFVFTDNSDPENGGWQISSADFLMAMENRTDSFLPAATVVRTENGKIVSLTKNAMPQ